MPRRSGPPRISCYALTVPGIEDLAAAELRGLNCTPTDILSRFDKRDGVVLFETDDLAAALRSTLAEDLFITLMDVPVPRTNAAPKVLARKLDAARFERALLQHHAVRPKTRGRSFKVVARAAGKQPFRREELAPPFARAVGALLPKWVPSAEAAALEIWVHVIGERALVGMRISGDELSQRRYKRAHLPASLKPTVARALVLLSDPRPHDVFIDPMAGAGTILRERGNAGAAGSVLGGDLDPEAVRAARANAGKRAGVVRWDATRLPLSSASVDAIVCNPPYGRQHEATAGLERLYARAAREMARVLRPDGRCVLLTGEPSLLLRTLPPSLQVRARRRMLLRGLPVTAFVIVRGAQGGA